MENNSRITKYFLLIGMIGFIAFTACNSTKRLDRKFVQVEFCGVFYKDQVLFFDKDSTYLDREITSGLTGLATSVVIRKKAFRRNLRLQVNGKSYPIPPKGIKKYLWINMDANGNVDVRFSEREFPQM